jgi:hypothetical protein
LAREVQRAIDCDVGEM